MENNDRSRDRKRVARGATLFTKKTENNGSPKSKIIRSRKSLGEVKIVTREIPDKQNENELIRKLEKEGIEVRSYKKRYLLRRIRARMSKLGHTRYEEYIKYLGVTSSEIRELQESLSINVTRFFRNRDTFEMIRDEILPQIFADAKQKGRKEVKIWSAGCAVGAEAYTMAMIASDIVPSNMTVRVIGTDIKEELLNIARYATYSDQYVAEMHPFEIQKYFNINNHNEHIVKPSIKRIVSFSKIDLMKDSFPASIDLILCRNVLIYIDREAQNEIISSFFKSLRDSGMLVLGRTETLFVDWRKHINIVSTKHRVYQKMSATPDSLPALEYKERPKSKPSRLGATETHQKRLEELKNFRKTYEDRKKVWEKRISDTERSRNQPTKIQAKSRFIRNKVNVKEPRPRFNTKNFNQQKTTSKFKEKGQLSSYRASLKKGTSSTKKGNLSNLVGTKTPEEVYRELRKMRERRKNKKESSK